jgi:hypothetical protein
LAGVVPGGVIVIVTIGLLLALVLALIDELRARGQSLTGWAVVIVCVVLLWGRLGGLA